MNKDKQSSLAKDVMQQLEQQKVPMRSRLYFVTLHAILVASASLILVFVAILVGVLVREIRIGRELGLQTFGQPGTQAFISAIPWLTVILVVVGGLALYRLIKRFDFSYRHGLFVTFASLVLAVGIITVGTIQLGVRDRIADIKPLRPLSSLRNFADERRETGVVEQITDQVIIIRTPDGREVTVQTDDQTRGLGEIQEGDIITVFGEAQGAVFDAFGIRPGEPSPAQNRPSVRGQRMHIR
jgi:hypothetical protein